MITVVEISEACQGSHGIMRNPDWSHRRQLSADRLPAITALRGPKEPEKRADIRPSMSPTEFYHIGIRPQSLKTSESSQTSRLTGASTMTPITSHLSSVPRVTEGIWGRDQIRHGLRIPSWAQGPAYHQRRELGMPVAIWQAWRHAPEIGKQNDRHPSDPLQNLPGIHMAVLEISAEATRPAGNPEIPASGA
jgi:hypothetical protein